MTVIQVYAPRSSHSDNVTEEFCEELQSITDEIPQNDILIVQGGWNATLARTRKPTGINFVGNPAIVEQLKEG